MRRPGHNQGTQHADVSAVQPIPGEDLVLPLGDPGGDPRDSASDMVGLDRKGRLQG